MPEAGDLPRVDNSKVLEAKTTFTDGQLKRWDADIHTILTLQSDHRFPGTPVVSGGYAVDILTGGKMRRPHQDIDFTVYTSGRKSNELNPSHSIPVILAKDSSTWLVTQDASDALQLKDPANKESTEQLDFHFSEREPDVTRVVQKTIVDSAGFTHTVLVEDLNYLTARKIGIINKRITMSPEEIQAHKRPLTQQDIDELILLSAQPEFNRDIVLDNMARAIIRKQGLTYSDAFSKAQAQMQLALETKI